MTRPNIESVEKQGVRHHDAGKQAPRASCKELTAALVVDGKEPMKLESEQKEKVAQCCEGQKRQGKGKEPIKQKAHTSPSPSEFCSPLIVV